jgi:hypothetical protein
MDETSAPTASDLAAIQARLDEFVAAGLVEILDYDEATDEGSLRFHPAWFPLLLAGRRDLIDRAFAKAGNDLTAARELLEREAAGLSSDAEATADRDE